MKFILGFCLLFCLISCANDSDSSLLSTQTRIATVQDIATHRPTTVVSTSTPTKRTLDNTIYLSPTRPLTPTAIPPTTSSTTIPISDKPIPQETEPTPLSVTPKPPSCPPDKEYESIVDFYNVEEYRGKHFDELPPGWQNRGGYLLRDHYQYSISVIGLEENSMLWLEEEICRAYYGTHSQAYTEIVDALFLPMKINEKDGPILITHTCWKIADYPANSEVEKHQRGDDTLFAIGSFKDDYDAPAEILFAWEINLESKRFEELSPESIDCADPSWLY